VYTRLGEGVHKTDEGVHKTGEGVHKTDGEGVHKTEARVYTRQEVENLVSGSLSGVCISFKK
jgi:hypothetical protein